MHENVKQCIEAVRSIAPDDLQTISPRLFETIAREIYDGDPALRSAIEARSGQFNPHGPMYLFVQQIVAYCCVFYSVIEVVGKIDHASTILLDRNAQFKIVEKAIGKLKLVGLTRTAEQLEGVKDKVLDYLTRPNNSVANPPKQT